MFSAQFEQDMVQVFVPVVEAELALLEVEQEGVRAHPPEPGQPRLGVAPEALDAVDVIPANHTAAELVGVVIDPQMLAIPHIDQAVVTPPAVGMDDAVEGDFPANRGQKHRFRAVGDDLGVDLVVSFVDAEDGGLPSRAASGLALDPAGSEVAFIDLDGAAEGPFEFAGFGHSLTQAGEQAVEGVAVEAGELGDLDGGEIGGDMAEEPPESGL